MPVPEPRDLRQASEVLGWLGEWRPGAKITGLEVPEFNGFSSETMMLDVWPPSATR